MEGETLTLAAMMRNDGPGGLLSPFAVKDRAARILALAEQERLLHWTLDLTKMEATADLVLETINSAYPTLDIPFHARWRHFMVAGIDRAADYRDRAGRIAYDMIFVSVLLDAGTGPDWRYTTRDGHVVTRSEGLAIASLEMFEAGFFSSDAADPLRADAARLRMITADELGQQMQVGEGNPLAGLEGRAGLLNRLGAALEAHPAIYGAPARPGGLFDRLQVFGASGELTAPGILRIILHTLDTIWPGRPMLDGVSLGDTWDYPPFADHDPTARLVPFHKLSQWLSYSLVEPLQWAGLSVSGIDDLTGLPEYRNGGLFMDMGVLRLKDAAQAARPHAAGSALIVEWRALTVALLARVAVILRQRLGMDEVSLPQAKVLEGGTWAAGRIIARRLREGGGPPLNIVSDGTVF